MTANRKNLIWRVPFFSRRAIFFGVRAENFTARARQYTAFVKFLRGDADFLRDAAENFRHAAENFTNAAERSASASKNSPPPAEHLGLEPKYIDRQRKNSDNLIKIFTFGLFVLKNERRVRAGFIKRRQILVEA